MLKIIFPVHRPVVQASQRQIYSKQVNKLGNNTKFISSITMQNVEYTVCRLDLFHNQCLLSFGLEGKGKTDIQ